MRNLMFGWLMLLALFARADEMQVLYDARCAHCHDGSVPKAPHLVKFQLMGADLIYAALTEGLMKPNATGIDHATLRRRPLVRFFVCNEDITHDSPDVPLPGAIATGAAPFCIIGAIAGG